MLLLLLLLLLPAPDDDDDDNDNDDEGLLLHSLAMQEIGQPAIRRGKVSQLAGAHAPRPPPPRAPPHTPPRSRGKFTDTATCARTAPHRTIRTPALTQPRPGGPL